MAGDDHLLDHQPQDGLSDLEARIVEVAAECSRDGFDPCDLAGGEFSPRGPGSEFCLFILHREDPVLNRGLASLEIVEIESARLVCIDQAFSLTVQILQPARCDPLNAKFSSDAESKVKSPLVVLTDEAC